MPSVKANRKIITSYRKKAQWKGNKVHNVKQWHYVIMQMTKTLKNSMISMVWDWEREGDVNYVFMGIT